MNKILFTIIAILLCFNTNGSEHKISTSTPQITTSSNLSGGLWLYILLGLAILIIFGLLFIILKGRYHTKNSRIDKKNSSDNLTTLKTKIKTLNQTLNLALDAGNLSIWTYNKKDNLFVCIQGKPLSKDGRFSLETHVYYTHPNEAHLMPNAIEDIYKGSKKRVDLQYRMNLNSDQYRWLQQIMIPEYNEDGSVRQIIGVRQDITEQLSFEEELKRGEKNLLFIIENLPIPIYIINPKANKISFRNKATTESLFHNSSDDINELISPNSYDYHFKINHQILSTASPYKAKESFELKNGEVTQSYVSKIVVDYEGEKQILVARFDMSEKSELKHITNVLSLSLSSINAFTWSVDTRTDIINFSNEIDTFKDIKSINQFISLIHPDDIKLFVNLIKNPNIELRTQFTIQFRANFASQENNYEWWEARSNYEIRKDGDSEYRLVYGVTININEQKKTEQKLIDNQNKLIAINDENKIILDNNLSALIYIDTNFTVQWTNINYFKELSNSNPWYKAGYNCYKLKGNQSPCNDCPIVRWNTTGKIEHNKVNIENSEMIYNCVVIPITNSNELKGYVIRYDDVTKQQHMIDNLYKAIIKAKESDRLKSAFLANMSHEIRTPLNAIIGFSNLLIEEGDDDTKKEYSKIVKENGNLLINLINDILDLSKIDAGVFELNEIETDFAMLFEDTVSAHKITNTNTDVELITKNPYSKLLIIVDVKRILQLMNNYISNAIKYTPKGTISIGYQVTNDELYFYVSDSGIGIAKEKQDKVFKRFEKLDSYAQGTGLGLAIVQAITSKMGGSCGFESEENKGSLFWIKIPIQIINNKDVIMAIEDNSLTTSTVESAKIDKLEILVVEDIKSNYLLVRHILKSHNITWVEDGFKGVEAAKNRCFDVILMDLHMPEMNGYEATKAIREFDKTTPIIAVTANVFEKNKKEAFEAGCSAFVNKPLNAKILTKTINDLVASIKK